MAQEGRWFIHTVKDPSVMIDENCMFVVDDDSMLYEINIDRESSKYIWHECIFKTVADHPGCAWVVDREQLVYFCRDNVPYFDCFGFESLPEGYYAIVWREDGYTL